MPDEYVKIFEEKLWPHFINFGFHIDIQNFSKHLILAWNIIPVVKYNAFYIMINKICTKNLLS